MMRTARKRDNPPINIYFLEKIMKNRILSSVIASVLLAAFTACGGAASSSAPPASSAPAPSAATGGGSEISGYVQGVTATEILIANSLPQTGNFAQSGIPAKAGLEAYLSYVNSNGGIDGRTIRYLHTDDESDPVKGKTSLQEYIYDDQVFAIVALGAPQFGTALVGATIDDLRESGIPAVYFGTGIGQLYADNAATNADGMNLFPVQPIYITEGQVMVARAVGDFNASRIGVIYTNDAAGSDMNTGAAKKCAELGIDFQSEQTPVAETDVSDAIAAIKSYNPDVIICAATQGSMPIIVKALAAQGLAVPVITSYANATAEIADAVGGDISGKFDLYSSAWMDETSGEHAEEMALYKQCVAKEYQSDPYAMYGWIAGHFFCEGLRRLVGKEVTWPGFIAAMESAPVSIPFGGDVDYSGGKRMGTPAMSMSKVNLAAPDGSNWELVAPLESIEEILAKG
jgi:ABC-type branched-subunit amino acid transport system substrate-binding protein